MKVPCAFDGSLLVNHTTQLGWCPPLQWTMEDAIAEEVFEKNGEKLPIGFFVSAIELGRELNKGTLERARNDICAELQTVDVLLLSSTADRNKQAEGIKHRELLFQDLEVVSKALDKTSRSTTTTATSEPTDLVFVDGSTPAHTTRNEQDVEAAGILIQLQAESSFRSGIPTSTLTTIVEPRATDVLFGSSPTAFEHVGNIGWRVLVAANKALYSALTSPREKTLLAQSIVQAVKNQNPPGRFLEKDPSGLWIEVDMQRAIDKTSQALRDAPPSLAPTHHVVARQRRTTTAASSSRRPLVERNTGFYRNVNTSAARVM